MSGSQCRNFHEHSVVHEGDRVMWVVVVIVVLYLVFSNTKGSRAAHFIDVGEKPLEEDMEDFLIMDYLSDEEINGH